MKSNTAPASVAEPSNPAGLVEKADVARFLGLTERSVENLQREGLPFYRIGCRRNRYDLQAIREWLARRCRVN